MDDIWPIVLMGAAGLLVGGSFSMYKQDSKRAAIVLGVLAAIALAGAILWWWPSS
ncbi:hypothetical protein [Stackebrandtia soli]|uniref:hypothetical protein n=1 Tax=Stackebrandtia soli TaxID=1892856 RepID=UPI0039E83934